MHIFSWKSKAANNFHKIFLDSALQIFEKLVIPNRTALESERKKFMHIDIYLLCIPLGALYKLSHLCKGNFLFPYFTGDINQTLLYTEQTEVVI